MASDLYSYKKPRKYGFPLNPVNLFPWYITVLSNWLSPAVISSNPIIVQWNQHDIVKSFKIRKISKYINKMNKKGSIKSLLAILRRFYGDRDASIYWAVRINVKKTKYARTSCGCGATADTAGDGLHEWNAANKSSNNSISCRLHLASVTLIAWATIVISPADPCVKWAQFAQIPNHHHHHRCIKCCAPSTLLITYKFDRDGRHPGYGVTLTQFHITGLVNYLPFNPVVYI